jgi:hypothetical protein
MAHSEHNRPKKSGAFFLVILGAILFMISPTWLASRPEIGFSTIALGFAIGGLGFYLRFVRK